MALTFVALYRGPDAKTAELIATSTDPETVRALVELLLCEPPREGFEDPAAYHLWRGRREALAVIHDEACAAADVASSPRGCDLRLVPDGGAPESAG